MKTAIKTKLSGTKKLVRKVLSKSSNTSNERVIQNQEVPMTDEALLSNEIGALREQILNLKAAINTLQAETEQKEIAIARLAREKEKLHLDLLKVKRSNSNLAKQLDEERKFYFKEKEIYCHEMNECKKLKKMLSSSTLNNEERNVEEYKDEIRKLKQTLNQTLEANYNLSIKFLRMKNTKTCLKTELKAIKLEHEKLENDYRTKIENLSAELNDLVNEKLKTPMSPSSKKYLQLVKQNSCLVYENLCLQLEVDNLNLKFERLKLERTKSETNNRLKYIHHNTQEREKHQKNKMLLEPKRVRIQEEAPEKLEKVQKPCCTKNVFPKEDKVVKIFERDELPGVPGIKIVNEKQHKMRAKKPKRKIKDNDESKDKNNFFPKNPDEQKDLVLNVPDHEIKIDDSSRKKILNKDHSKLALFQVSDMHSVVSSDHVSLATSLTRSQSSPDIVQSTFFHKNGT